MGVERRDKFKEYYKENGKRLGFFDMGAIWDETR